MDRKSQKEEMEKDTVVAFEEDAITACLLQVRTMRHKGFDKKPQISVWIK